MGDTTTAAFQFAGAGQPQNASTETPAEQVVVEQHAETQVKPLTRDDVLQLFDELFDRKAQSITDKTTARVQKELNRLQKAGISVTPDQVKTLVQTDETEVQPAKSSRSQPAQAQPEAPQLDPLTATAIEMFAEAGINPNEIPEDDPDFHLIKEGQVAGKRGYIKGIAAYIEAHEERATAQKGSPARIPNLAGSGGQVKTGKDAVIAELQAIIAHPTPQNQPRLRELRQQLAQYK